MEQVVYADIYFLINFSMDFLCLFLCAKLLATPFFIGRALISAALGGLYAILALFLDLSPLPSLLVDLSVCALLCAVAFFRRGQARLSLISTPVFLAVSMLLGGVMTALFYLLNRLELPLSEIEPDGLSAWGFAILAAISGLITYLSERFFRRRTAAKRATLVVTLFGRTATIPALCDSGNLLRDPLSGKCCIVVDADACRALLPPLLYEAAKRGKTPPPDLPGELLARIRLIPTHTATGEALLIALRVDDIKICTDKAPHTVDALIALSALQGRADSTSALIPAELLI